MQLFVCSTKLPIGSSPERRASTLGYLPSLTEKKIHNWVNFNEIQASKEALNSKFMECQKISKPLIHHGSLLNFSNHLTGAKVVKTFLMLLGLEWLELEKGSFNFLDNS